MAAVPRFYEKVLSDPLVGAMFEGLDMDGQTRKQMSFLARAFDGPDEYHGRDLRSAHASLVRDHSLSDAHFDRIVDLLEQTLAELNIAVSLRSEVRALLEKHRDEVLGR